MKDWIIRDFLADKRNDETMLLVSISIMITIDLGIKLHEQQSAALESENKFFAKAQLIALLMQQEAKESRHL